MSTSEIYIGKRVSYDGHLCTIRYIGEVADTKGQWLGVEWDDPARGKHTGEHKGVEYFQCHCKSPKAGSFVRPNRPVDTPRSVVNGVYHKYVSDSPSYANEKEMEDATIRISGKEVEEVGFDKIRRQLADLKELRIVLLDSLCISRPEARSDETANLDALNFDNNNDIPRDIGETCPKIVELDLSRNLFETWEEIIDIVRQLPALNNLRLDGNRFRTTKSSNYDQVLKLVPFTDLEGLGIDDTFLDWSSVIQIASSFPALLSLSACGNGFGALSCNPTNTKLVSLSLDRNDFKSLQALSPLIKCESLHRLSLKGNSIQHVLDMNAQQDTKLVFSPSLENIDLSFNSITSWSFIDSLCTIFPGLTTLRVSQNPLFENLVAADGRLLNADDGYMLTIARIGRLHTLNFSPITAKERFNAENYYLSQIALEISNASGVEADIAQIVSTHSRYAELCSIYGEPVIARKKTASIDANSLAARFIKVTFDLQDFPGVKDQRLQLELEIPRSFTIYNVLGMVGKKVGAAPMLLRLVWDTGEEELGQSSDEEKDDEERNSGRTQAAGKAFSQGRVKSNRQEVLVPRTRSLGTWIEGMAANIKVVFDDEALDRRDQALQDAQQRIKSQTRSATE